MSGEFSRPYLQRTTSMRFKSVRIEFIVSYIMKMSSSYAALRITGSFPRPRERAEKTLWNKAATSLVRAGCVSRHSAADCSTLLCKDDVSGCLTILVNHAPKLSSGFMPLA